MQATCSLRQPTRAPMLSAAALIATAGLAFLWAVAANPHVDWHSVIEFAAAVTVIGGAVGIVGKGLVWVVVTCRSRWAAHQQHLRLLQEAEEGRIKARVVADIEAAHASALAQLRAEQQIAQADLTQTILAVQEAVGVEETDGLRGAFYTHRDDDKESFAAIILRMDGFEGKLDTVLELLGGKVQGETL